MTPITSPAGPVVAIGRQMGSGGRQIGRMLAERLGIDFYDRALLARAAGDAGLSEDFFRRHDERYPRFVASLFGFSQGDTPLNAYAGAPFGGDAAYAAMADLIRRLADERPCVIVGRTSDYILRDHPRAASVFIHAPLDHCARRLIERGDCPTLPQAAAAVRRANKIRASYYNFYTDRRWGDAASYDLCLDSSLQSPEATVDIIVDYLRRRSLL